MYVLNLAGPQQPQHLREIHQQVQYASPTDGRMNGTACITSWTIGCPSLKGPYLPKVLTVNDNVPVEESSSVVAQPPPPLPTRPRLGFLRYITNPLPGYHDAADTLRNLRDILSHATMTTLLLHQQQQQQYVKQHWFLYRISNYTFQDELVALFQQYNQSYTIVELDWKLYARIPYTFHYFDHYKGMRDTIHNKWYRTTFPPAKKAAVLGSAIHDKVLYLYGGVRNFMLDWAALEWGNDDDDAIDWWWVLLEPDTLWTESLHRVVTEILGSPEAADWKYVVLPRVQLQSPLGTDGNILGPSPPSPWKSTMEHIPEDSYDQTAKLIRQSPSDGYQLIFRADAVGRFHAHLRPGRYDVEEFLSRLHVDVYGGWNVTVDGQWLPWEVKLLQAVGTPEGDGNGNKEPVSSSSNDPWRLSRQAPPLDWKFGSSVAIINSTVVRLYSQKATILRREDPINATFLNQQYLTEAMAAYLPEVDYQAHLIKSNMTGPFREVFANQLLFYDRALLQYERKMYQQAQWESIDKMDRWVQSLVWMIYKLVEQARIARQHGPWSVTTKEGGHLAPSHNSHDYYNVAPHFVPQILDDGTLGLSLPYVKKGVGPIPEQNALFGARASRYDETRFVSMSYNVTILSLATFYTGQDLFAQYAVKILKQWFWDETAMTPHLRFASVRWNHNESEWQGEHVTDLKSVYFLLDAVKLLEEGGYLTGRQTKMIRRWMSDFLEWLETDSQAVGHAASAEDHQGVYYDIMCLSIAYYLEDEVRALHYVNMAASRMRAHFDERYELVEELKKSQCEDGQMQALYAWHTLARMADHLGVDLWMQKVSDIDENKKIQDQVRIPEDPLYDPSSMEALPTLCAGSARAIPFVIDRPPCKGSSSNDRRQSHIRWWPLLDGYRRQCPAWPLENYNGTSWMTPKWAKRPPTGRYHMPFLFLHQENIAPFWNLGYRIKPRE
eukprot:scaffold34922_cov141-Amphora_coffeaeformis.AAC.9